MMKSKKFAMMTASAALVAALAVPAVAVAAQGDGATGRGHCMLRGDQVACTFAAETGKAAQQIRACIGQASGAGFVDEDGDGVCDNRALGQSGCNFMDVDGDGVCDNRGDRAGAGFADADGDGICDNRGDRTGAAHHGNGGGHRAQCAL